MSEANRKIRVLIADDSAVISKMLDALFALADDITVVGHARDGEEAVNLTKSLRPDIVTMDIHMPKLNGLEATKKIMHECPTPILVISSYVDNEEMNITFNAMNEGALAVLPKPKYLADEGFISSRMSLLDTVRSLSEVKVITRSSKYKREVEKCPITKGHEAIKVCAIGASTGGPAALKVLLDSISKDLPFPIVIVQHMSIGFLSGFVSWLDKSTDLSVSIVKDSMALKPGSVYFADEDKHLVLYKGSDNKVMARHLVSDPVNYFRPSVTVLFDSVARNFGKNSLACLLTGMGRDGADAMNTLNKAGALTVVQSKSSSVVFGMPGSALELNNNHQVLDIECFSDFINSTSKGVRNG